MKLNPDLRSRVPIGILYVFVISTACLYSKLTTLILVLLFFLFCLYEFLQATAKTSSTKTYLLGAGIGIAAFVNSSLLSLDSAPLLFSALAVTLLTLGALYLVIKKKSLTSILPITLSTLGYILIPFLATFLFINTQEYSNIIILGTFIILWLNDAGAYFVGKAFGKTKLFVSVSPNKSWEGSIGGGIVGILISIAVFYAIGGYSLSHWLILSVIIWITGSYGDLFESSWKRSLGLKDSGSLMKGHGGFLDRLDSFIFAMPFVTIYHYLIVL